MFRRQRPLRRLALSRAARRRRQSFAPPERLPAPPEAKPAPDRAPAAPDYDDLSDRTLRWEAD